MITLHRFGNPFQTDSVVEKLTPVEADFSIGQLQVSPDSISFTYTMNDTDVIYGLGEANRGINKRGYIYVSNATDDPNHTEEKVSLYGAHNFIIIDGAKKVGLFFDYPGTITYDIGYTTSNLLSISCGDANLDIYEITGETAYDIVKEFRSIIGQSYIPPKFAFGYGQSRWGYKCQADIEKVVDGYQKLGIPLDMVYMDIDYMQDYKDFTVNPQRFPDFADFVKRMQEKHIHLVPIIDAGVKVEPGYDVYEEGVANNYFCKMEDGSDFLAAVWPGWTHFPDVLNPKARAWFGEKYKVFTDLGIDGFWNDMCEPAIFYSKAGVDGVKKAIDDYVSKSNQNSESGSLSFAKREGEISESDILNTAQEIPGEVREKLGRLQNAPTDYQSFYHNVDGQMIRHDKVHNLYGYNMTRAASEAFEKIAPGKEFLMFSRSSFIGAHRYGGIWMGDNQSWWSHLLLNIKMLPSLNMCGFLYVGADLGGFGSHTTRDLLLRWLALGVFTPLMRNHSALGTREQECYQFENPEDFKAVISVRYRLIPYLYDTFVRSAKENDMMFKPMAFVYPEDSFCRSIEDQLMLGDELMIAPVYTQNAIGRYVYLPEEMMFVKFLPDGSYTRQILDPGHHFIEVALNEVPLFIRKGKNIPLAKPACSVAELDEQDLEHVGYLY